MISVELLCSLLERDYGVAPLQEALRAPSRGSRRRLAKGNCLYMLVYYTDNDFIRSSVVFLSIFLNVEVLQLKM